MKIERRLVSVYLPVSVGTLVSIVEAVTSEFPDAIVDNPENSGGFHIVIVEEAADNSFRGIRPYTTRDAELDTVRPK